MTLMKLSLWKQPFHARHWLQRFKTLYLLGSRLEPPAFLFFIFVCRFFLFGSTRLTRSDFIEVGCHDNEAGVPLTRSSVRFWRKKRQWHGSTYCMTHTLRAITQVTILKTELSLSNSHISSADKRIWMSTEVLERGYSVSQIFWCRIFVDQLSNETQNSNTSAESSLY